MKKCTSLTSPRYLGAMFVGEELASAIGAMMTARVDGGDGGDG